MASQPEKIASDSSVVWLFLMVTRRVIEPAALLSTSVCAPTSRSGIGERRLPVAAAVDDGFGASGVDSTFNEPTRCSTTSMNGSGLTRCTTSAGFSFASVVTRLVGADSRTPVPVT